MECTIPITRSTMPPIEEYIDEIRDIWDSRSLTNFGPKHQKLEYSLRKYLKCKNLSLFANGHLALEAALEGLALTGEVITTPFTYASTTQAIVHAGLVPVFCDIDPITYTLDPDRVESLITEKTCAIMPVHVYGNLCDHRRIDSIARKNNLVVIYDAAHAFGMEDDGVPVGTFGDASMFSLHATKVFHSIEGGALTYREDDYADCFEQWRMFGMQGKEDVVCVGTNAKLTEFAAAMGLCNLRHVEEQIALRKAAVARYHERFDGHNGIVLCSERPGIKYNYAYMPVRFIDRLFGKTRDMVCGELEREQIFARRYFYPLTSEFSMYQGMFPITATPIAKEISEQILCLPLYADLQITDVDRICDIVLGR